MIRIGGLQKITLLDFPDVLAAIVFVVGCNFRCGYCHNPDLVEIKTGKKLISEKEVLDFLANRKKLLEGVCISGGEPLIYKDLDKFLVKIKNLGYLIKLDTNGYEPLALKKLLAMNLLDYIAMDIKGSLDKYSLIAGVKVDVNKIKQSLGLVMSSGLPYEFRTTVLPKFHDLAEIEKIAKMIKGAENYYLQQFSSQKTYKSDFQTEKKFTRQELETMRQLALKYVNKCQIRG